jgi:hypothetical protein
VEHIYLGNPVVAVDAIPEGEAGGRFLRRPVGPVSDLLEIVYAEPVQLAFQNFGNTLDHLEIFGSVGFGSVDDSEESVVAGFSGSKVVREIGSGFLGGRRRSSSIRDYDFFSRRITSAPSPA